jgi:hypothetical protein
LAVRITVVVVQAGRREGRMSDFEEQLLTRIMLENSLDAVFVGPLESMTADGTDALCLSKVPESSIVLGWLASEEAEFHFERLQLPWAHRFAQRGENGVRTIQYRQIKMEQSIDNLMNSLLQVLKNANVKTLQISLSPPLVRALKPISTTPVSPSIVDSQQKPAANDQPKFAGKLDRTTGSLPMRPFENGVKTAEADRDELDQLVDDLESLDL